MSKKISHRTEFIGLNDNDQFPFVEAFKTLRTNLMFGMAQREYKRLLITSSLPSEGKTMTAFSLSIAFAQTGVKVLIIDADMRNPKIHRYIKQKNDIGLSAVLSGTATVDEAVVSTEYENLYVMKTGQIPPNPAELLEGRYVESAYAEMDSKFDYVIFDTPPINLVADALSIAKQNVAMLFVVREAVSTHEELKKSLRAIEQANLDLIGIVLNESREEKRGGYYKSKYGYKYGYGYGYGYGKRVKDIKKAQEEQNEEEASEEDASANSKKSK